MQDNSQFTEPQQAEAHRMEPQPAPQSSRKTPQWVPFVAVAALVIVVGVAGFFIGRGSASSGDSATASADKTKAQLTAAYQHCRSKDDDSTVSLGDGGDSILIDTESEYGSVAGLECILDTLKTPQSVTAEIGRTTAMMGVQDADTGGLHYSWSYHPDNGVNMVITASE